LRRSAAEPQFEAVAEEEIKLQDLLDKELTPQEKERKLIREEVEKLIDVNPEDATNLIRTWLLEEGV
jgi:flagellar M-ring protein FliF